MSAESLDKLRSPWKMDQMRMKVALAAPELLYDAPRVREEKRTLNAQRDELAAQWRAKELMREAEKPIRISRRELGASLEGKLKTQMRARREATAKANERIKQRIQRNS